MKKWLLVLLCLMAVTSMVAAYLYLHSPYRLTLESGRHGRVMEWIRDSQAHQEWSVNADKRCRDAAFSFPTNGYIGYLWGDSFRPFHQHQGIDIFSGLSPGEAPVYAVYAGYLTRLSDWKATVVIRIPDDPLQPGRQIWTYYTHMADQAGESFITPEFPPGTQEVFVPQGTFLGYQGNFSGTPGNPTGIHLHFSIVRDDGKGGFLNELEIQNTLDPSPYFDLQLNAVNDPKSPPICISTADAVEVR